MRLLSKSGTAPATRHWECIHCDLLDPHACIGRLETDAKAPLSATDIALRLADRALPTDQEAPRLRQLAEDLSRDWDAFMWTLSNEPPMSLISSQR